MNNKKQSIADIEAFIKKYCFIEGTYTISDDGIVDVNGRVSINGIYKDSLKTIPIQFGIVSDRFDISNIDIINLNGFPNYSNHIDLDNLKNLTSLEGIGSCEILSIYKCNNPLLTNLNGIKNCKHFIGGKLNLKEYGLIPNNLKEITLDVSPKPTADEMRKLILLNTKFNTAKNGKNGKWLKLLRNNNIHQDLFRTVCEFERLYNEPWIKPEDKIEIIDSDLTVSL